MFNIQRSGAELTIMLKWSRSHDNMAAMPLYGKTLKNHLLENKNTMTLKFGIQHCVREYYQDCSNYDHEIVTYAFG